MINRKELKTRAKAGVKRNYWRTVLVSLLSTLLVCGTGASSSSVGGSSSVDGTEVDIALQSIPAEVWAIAGAITLVGVLIAVVISLFVINPLRVGIYGYATDAVRDQATLSALGRGFQTGYLRNVKTMLCVSVFIALWSLLLVIPGIVKSYEYKMIPYLLAEHPEMSRAEAFVASKRMMSGNKWGAFVLDLSFILWNILSVITLGLVGVFWVGPYQMLTQAALYDSLKQSAQ